MARSGNKTAPRKRVALQTLALLTLAAMAQGKNATETERPYPGKVGTVPSNQVCSQPDQPPGVKPGSCLENTCIPTAVGVNASMHTTVRYCLQRPRLYDGTFVLLDRISKEYFTGTGFKSNGTQQCGEHTYTLDSFAVKPASATNQTYDIMWKYFFLPVWGSATNRTQDKFPNMLAEAGIAAQPPYTGLVDDCPVKPDYEFVLPPTGKQDAINFASPLPGCVTPGKPWEINIQTHLETVKQADFRVNLQIGTGGDVYLGPDDIYVAESNIYGVKGVNASRYNYTSPGYYSTQKIKFTANQTALLNPTDKVYAAAFFVPANSTFGTGWEVIEREFYLEMQFCQTA